MYKRIVYWDKRSGLLFLDFFIIFLNRILILPRYFLGSKDKNLRWNNSLNPKISNPISASHEPGENGVSNANKPRIINTTPRIILRALRMCQSVICAICSSNLFNLWFSNAEYAPNTTSSKKSVSVSVLKEHRIHKSVLKFRLVGDFDVFNLAG